MYLFGYENGLVSTEEDEELSFVQPTLRGADA